MKCTQRLFRFITATMLAVVLLTSTTSPISAQAVKVSELTAKTWATLNGTDLLMIARPSDQNYKLAISEITGQFAPLVSPSFTTPTLGVATATSINKVTITAPATSATITITNGKTFTSSNTLTLAGTDGSTLNIGTGGTLGTAAYVTLGANVGTALAVNIGSAGAPVLFDGAGGTPSSLTLTNATGLPPAGVTGTAAILGANTFTRLQTITQGTANEGVLASTGHSLTGSSTASAVTISSTINTSGVVNVFDHVVTETASGAGSRLFRVMGGASGTTEQFAVGAGNAGVIIKDGHSFKSNGGSAFLMTIGGTNNFQVSNGGGATVINYLNFGTAGLANETTLGSTTRDTLFLKRGANPQTFEVYGDATKKFTLSHNGSGGELTVSDSGNLVINSTMSLPSGVDFIFDTSTGTKIGTGTDQKIGFFNATPVVQQTNVANPTGGAVQDAEARTAIDAILSRLEALGLFAP